MRSEGDLLFGLAHDVVHMRVRIEGNVMNNESATLGISKKFLETMPLYFVDIL